MSRSRWSIRGRGKQRNSKGPMRSMSDNEIDAVGLKAKDKRGMFSKMRSWFSRKPKQRRDSAPSTPSKLDEDEQGDYDDGIDFDSTTLTDMPVQNLHSRAPSETVQKQENSERVAHPLSQHPQTFGLQDELARKLKERNQSQNWTPEEKGTREISRKPKAKSDVHETEAGNSMSHRNPTSPRKADQSTISTSKTAFAKGNDIRALYNTKKSSSNLASASSGSSGAPMINSPFGNHSDNMPDQSVMDAVLRVQKKINQKACISDSEDDEPIEFKENGSIHQQLARRDTIARQKEIKNLLEQAQSNETKEQKNNIKLQLSRRLSQRPSASEIKDRGILKVKSTQERKDEKEKIKKELSRRLSQRPTVQTLIKKNVIKFEEYVDVYEIQYVDRKADKPWTRLTATEKASIRKELNQYKANEMEVHEESQFYTRFHRE